MPKTDIEVEIKTLLGDEDSAEKLRSNLKEINPTIIAKSSYTQLNHYFTGGDLSDLIKNLTPYLEAEVIVRMQEMADKGNAISVRTREMNGEAKIVMKASINDETSSNGVMRLEVEAVVPGFTLEKLDGEVLAAGYEYQAKWSRTREEYTVHGITICLDKNAGYGYLAEFEKVIQDSAEAENTKTELLAFMETLGLVELSQERLERMFSYYNEHWPEYYGTEEIFTIQ